MRGVCPLEAIRLTNILSYRSSGVFLPLQPLNIFIGPNASGKSNFIECMSLLSSAPGDIQRPIREGGGVSEWIWKGPGTNRRATMEALLSIPGARLLFPVRYSVSFEESHSRFHLAEEVLNTETLGCGSEEWQTFYAFREGQARLLAKPPDDSAETRTSRMLTPGEFNPGQSILAQRRDPHSYPEITYAASLFESMRLYKDWDTGRNAAVRLPQKADLPNDALLPDASNLGLILNDLLIRPAVKKKILSYLHRFYSRISDIATKTQGNTIQIFLHEEGLEHAVPATRFSDGTLRFLCLLAMLCHPEPPPIVCIEEPESGLHPDAIPIVADLLKEASVRTQLFVTTHSDVLVDEMTDMPDAVIVCERNDEGTRLTRLDSARLATWLERYRLGDLWQMGELGGNPR